MSNIIQFEAKRIQKTHLASHQSPDALLTVFAKDAKMEYWNDIWWKTRSVLWLHFASN